MTWPVQLENAWNAVRFREAIAFLTSRIPGPRPTLEAIEAGAAGEAFWVSDIALASVVTDVYESLNRAVATGESFDTWRDAVIASMRTHYPENMSEAEVDARVALIFRNNVQKAYATGRYQQAQNPAVKRARPFFMYDAVLDGRTTSGCKSLNGVILPQDDPFWDTQSPPRHHNCRAGLRTMSRRQAEARGGATLVLPTEPAQSGFGHRPGTEQPFRPESGRYPDEVQAIMNDRARDEGAL